MVCAFQVFCYTLAFLGTGFSSNLQTIYTIWTERHYKWIRSWFIKANYARKLKAAHAIVLLLGPHNEAKQNRVWVETDTRSHIGHLIRNLSTTWTTTGPGPRILRGSTSVMRAESAERCQACAETGKAAASTWGPSQVSCVSSICDSVHTWGTFSPLSIKKKKPGD